MMTAPAWCAKWVNETRFGDKGRGPIEFDCWGLARAVLAEQFGIRDLPDYSECYSNAQDKESVARAVRAGLAIGWNKVDEARPGDLVILRLLGRPWHCAVAVGGDWMLHTVEGTDTIVEQWSRPLWKNRIEGFYRYAEHN